MSIDPRLPYHIRPPQLDLQKGIPRSAEFNDPYYSLKDGLGETQHIFLEGTSCKERLAQGPLVIAELGFGSGLNILALLDMWLSMGCKHPLHIITLEGFPLSGSQLHAALTPWQARLARVITALLEIYPGPTPGFHTRSLFDGRVTITWLFGQAQEVLPLAEFKADIWWLDGFAPAKNPLMWSEDVLAQVTRLSANNTRLATFSVAGTVRRALTSLGWHLQKRPGFAGKRECLSACLTKGEAARTGNPFKSALVVGGGIGGACLAHALAREGVNVTLLEEGKHLGAGASGNLLALLEPRMAIAGASTFELDRLASLYTPWFYETLGAFEGSRGLYKRGRDTRATARHQDWLAASLLPSDYMQEGKEAGWLYFPKAGVINPKHALEALTKNVKRRFNSKIKHAEAQRVILEAGTHLTADLVFLATGHRIAQLAPCLEDLVSASRGQAMTSGLGQAPFIPRSYLGYAACNAEGRILVGASYHRENDTLRKSETELNDEAKADILAKATALGLDSKILRTLSPARYRAFTRSRRPIATALENGPYILSALGSRGFSTAPLLAQDLTLRALYGLSILPKTMVGSFEV